MAGVARAAGRPETLSLGGDGWRFRGFLGDAWRWVRLGEPLPDSLPASVPGSVVHDLWRADAVPDPYHGRNSLAIEWVPARSWVYQREFTPPRLPPAWRAQLAFAGIDHESSVFLNGDLLGAHVGMFTPASWEVADRLRADEPNLVTVVIAPAPDEPPQVGDTARARSHKSRMTYGWDFCPRMVHQGIWDEVSLRVSGPVRIDDLWVRALLGADLGSAVLMAAAELDAPSAQAVDLELRVAREGRLVAEQRSAASVSAGRSPFSAELSLERPDLWWPNGAGPAPLYEAELLVRCADGTISDGRRTRFGIRSVELVANDGAPPGARPYTFVVNGRRTYLTGWNWVPIDVLYGVPRRERLERLLTLARRARVNLLRVWGGGLIEREPFYELCDRLGIMVWQEFAQSSSGIASRPSADPAFVETMAAEAAQIVPGRRNHPSLVVWGGGNELADEAGRPLGDDEPVLAALREQVRRLDPDRAWLPTSPSGPVGLSPPAASAADPRALGDVHGPWEHQGLGAHQALYDGGTSLLHSEFGVEGMASVRTLLATIDVEDRWPPSRANPTWAHLGAWWINEPLVQATFGGIGDLATLVAASQYLQAEGLRYAVEANRRRQYRNSGSIPWQFNEPYPNGFSTAAVDHRAVPKAAYHAVARAYESIHLSARFATEAWAGRERFAAEVWVSSFGGPLTTARLRTRSVSGSGALLHERVEAVALAADASIPLVDVEWPLGALDDELFALVLQLHDPDGRLRSDSRYLFSRTADLAPLVRAGPTSLEVAREDLGPDAWRIALRNAGPRIALLVHLEDARPDAGATGWPYLSDDQLSLLPGEATTVDVEWSGVPAAERGLRVAGWNTTVARV